MWRADSPYPSFGSVLRVYDVDPPFPLPPVAAAQLGSYTLVQVTPACAISCSATSTAAKVAIVRVERLHRGPRNVCASASVVTDTQTQQVSTC